MAHHLSLSILLTAAASSSRCATTASAYTLSPLVFLSLFFRLQMSFCVCAIASVSLYGVRKARMVIICLIYTSVCLYRLVYTLYLLYTGSKCNQHCKWRVNVSVMKLLIGLLPLYYVINSQYKHHAGTRNTATGCDIYCPHHNSAHIHTHTHQPLDLAYSLPQHTWHPLIITVSCCRALMINLCSFLG